MKKAMFSFRPLSTRRRRSTQGLGHRGNSSAGSARNRMHDDPRWLFKSPLITGVSTVFVPRQSRVASLTYRRAFPLEKPTIHVDRMEFALAWRYERPTDRIGEGSSLGQWLAQRSKSNDLPAGNAILAALCHRNPVSGRRERFAIGIAQRNVSRSISIPSKLFDTLQCRRLLA